MLSTKPCEVYNVHSAHLLVAQLDEIYNSPHHQANKEILHNNVQWSDKDCSTIQIIAS